MTDIINVTPSTPDTIIVTQPADNTTVLTVGVGQGGAVGQAGPTGPTGATGPAGPGVAAGGTAGQVLSKINGTDYNTQWVTLVTGVTSVDGLVGAVDLTGKYLTQTNALSTYEPKITAGTTSQYWRGDKTWQTFPTIPTTTSALTNDSGFITSSALTPYLTSSTAASTYEPKITAGTTSQYWRGDKTWQTLPVIPTNVGDFTNNVGYLTSSALNPYLTSSAASTTYAPIGQTMYLGTTAVAINRPSATGLSLAGVSIDGNAGTVTNGIYTTTTSLPNVTSVNGTTIPASGTLLTSGTSASGDLTGTYPGPTLVALSPSPAGTYGSASVVPRITLDAQGRTTSVTNTNIAINGSAIDNASITAAKLATYATAPSYYYAVAGASYVTLVSGNLPANFTYSPYGTTNTPLTTGVALPAIAQTYYIQGYTQFTFGTKASGSLSFQISGTNLASYDVSLLWSNFTGSGANATSSTRLADTISTGSTAILSTATTQSAHIIEFRGIIRTNGSAATVLPTVSSSTGTTVGAGLRVYGGSYIMLTPITDASTNTIGSWS